MLIIFVQFKIFFAYRINFVPKNFLKICFSNEKEYKNIFKNSTCEKEFVKIQIGVEFR